MATMFPRALDRDDVKSEAELEVFHELEQQLPNEWLVFHSVSWLVRDPGEGAKDGEIDFVLVHPDRAIVCLEVKGGKSPATTVSGSATARAGGRRPRIHSRRRSTTATTSPG
jgi:hypothetical protein